MNSRKVNGLWMVALLFCCFFILSLHYGCGVDIGCPFKAITGLPCPGCGGMRSLDALLHGHWMQALTINPLSVALIMALLLSFCWLTIDLFWGRNSFLRYCKQFNNRKVLIFIILLLLANWIRNILEGR
ncbi:MAG: DUF2752 domain-containing protein [Alistipes sp.]